MAQHSIIGKPLAMIESGAKVTGLGKYADDLSVPGMLIGRILHSPHAHAIIRSIDTSAAEALPGVVKICVAKDVPGTNRMPLVVNDQPFLAEGRVRFHGEAVAAVAAESREIAELARDLIKVEYNALPAVLDPLDALKPGAPLVLDFAEDVASGSGGIVVFTIQMPGPDGEPLWQESFGVAVGQVGSPGVLRDGALEFPAHELPESSR